MITAAELVVRALSSIVDVPVSAKVPPNRPEVFVRVDQAAPIALSPSHDRTTVIIQVYGTHRHQEQVLDIIGTCRNYLRFSIETDVPEIVGWEETSGPVEFLDPDIAETSTRWQLAGNIFQTLA